MGAEPRSAAAREALWEGMDRLVDRTGPAGLEAHRIQAWAADRRRRRGLPLDAELAAAEGRATNADRLSVMLLSIVRDAIDGPLVVLKGPELAALYPRPWMRPAVDLDVLVPEVEDVHARLIAAGFQPFGSRTEYEGHRHERPLWLPDLPLGLELHREPGWPDWISPPSPGSLFDAAVPSRSGTAGVSALPGDLHALVVALHSWQHAPLRDARDLLDLALVVADAGRGPCLARARAAGAERALLTNLAAADALLLGGRRTAPMATWARHLDPLRPRSTGSWFLAQALSPFWAMPPASAAVAGMRAATARMRATDHESSGARISSLAASLRRLRAPKG